MLPIRYRLRRSRDLRELKQFGRSLRHPLAIMVVQQNEGSVSQFAFAASRRVGRAVARNRAKRMMREAIRRHLAEVKEGWNCLFIARRGAAEAKSVEVERAMVQLLRRASLLDTPAAGPTLGEGD